MNPERKLDEMLEQSGAVLVREGKHEVYKLPNGGTFTRSKTPSDHRTVLNQVSDLRRALQGGTMSQTGNQPAQTIQGGLSATEHAGMQPREQEDTWEGVTQESEPATPPKSELRQRLDAQIAELETVHAALKAQLEDNQKRMDRLTKVLLVVEDDPELEETLISVLLPKQPPATERRAKLGRRLGGRAFGRKGPREPRQIPPGPPQAITAPSQVTRNLVFAATQTFDKEFNTTDVVRRMIGETDMPPEQYKVIRSCISQNMLALAKRGELIQVSRGQGHTPSRWSKVDMAVIQHKRS